MTDELRTTALTARHLAAGAKLAPFAGWSMPLRFTGTVIEHEAVRSSVGIFDVSHLGTLHIDGPGARAAVAASFTNDPSGLEDGASQYTLCCDEDGGIVDDLIVYRLASDRWVAMPNAANTEEVARVLRAAADPAGSDGADAAGAAGADGATSVTDRSADRAILAIQGPRALDLADGIVAELGGGVRVSDVRYLGVAEVELAGEDAIVCRTGYTGEPGCEIVVGGEVAGQIWDLAVAAGAQRCGLGARDTLRLEMGYPLHGNDLSVDTDPYEAGLGWAVKLERGTFRGDEALRAAKQAGPSRRLRGIVVDGRRPIRAGMTVTRSRVRVGELTSGGFSPSLQKGVGLGYLDVEVAIGAAVEIDVRGTVVAGEVVKPPFVARDPRG